MGTLVTFWEADTRFKSRKPNVLTAGCPRLRSAHALARLCYDTLLEYGLQAKLAVEKNMVTPAVEAIVEANTLLSGLGFEAAVWREPIPFTMASRVLNFRSQTSRPESGFRYHRPNGTKAVLRMKSRKCWISA